MTFLAGSLQKVYITKEVEVGLGKIQRLIIRLIVVLKFVVAKRQLFSLEQTYDNPKLTVMDCTESQINQSGNLVYCNWL